MPDQQERHGRYPFRWDSTVSAGNVLTAASLVVGLAVWGTRLEGRVDTEALLRERLESSTLASITSLKTEQAASNARLEAKIAEEAERSRDADGQINGWLQRINDRLTNLLIEDHHDDHARSQSGKEP